MQRRYYIFSILTALDKIKSKKIPHTLSYESEGDMPTNSNLLFFLISTNTYVGYFIQSP